VSIPTVVVGVSWSDWEALVPTVVVGVSWSDCEALVSRSDCDALVPTVVVSASRSDCDALVPTAVVPPFLHVALRALWLECGPVEKEKRPPPSRQRATYVAVCMPVASKEAI
jgi:hypothetical protein